MKRPNPRKQVKKTQPDPIPSRYLQEVLNEALPSGYEQIFSDLAKEVGNEEPS